MKKVILLIMPVLMIGLMSCKKEIYGCTDQTAENYSTFATVNDGSCYHYNAPNIPDEVLVSNIINNVPWQQGSSYWHINLQWTEITNDVLDNGTVSVYARDSGGDWIELPVTFFVSTTYSSIMTASYSVGEVSIVWEDSDGYLPNEPPVLDFKLVILK